jgi:alpha-L-rhamnosidase
MRATHLLTEYLTNPLGLSIAKPRFYWNREGGVSQTAYQIIAKRNREVVWDSGVVQSSSMTHILYCGVSLQSRDRVEWAVRLWDEKRQVGPWVESWFELGLLQPDDWKAKWITGDYRPKKNVRWPVDCFKKEFPVVKAVAKARLYITACGLYEVKINGRRIGDFALAPGCTDYRKRLQYQTYDITDLLEAQNILEIQLADGWYRGSIGCWGVTNVFGRRTKLLCQLEITYADGSTEMVISDGSFQWSNDGPVRFADLKDGEVYDASMIPGYQRKAKLTTERLAPAASNNVQPKEQEVFTAKLITTPSGKKVLDFGQNIAGFAGFTVKGRKGQEIKLRLGEILDENGEFTQENMQVKKPVKEFGKLTEILLITGQTKKIREELQPTPLQEVIFYCSGNTDQYKTAFAIFGFRYALVETEIPLELSGFKAIAVYSDMEQTGNFECSNTDVNQFFQNTVWSMKSNFLDVPTDCPTRERLGWTGDAQVFFNTASYLMNVASFFRKWLLDINDSQFKNGKSSAVIPYNGASLAYDNTGGSVGWGDAVVLIPYRYWKRYGDASLISEFYGMMRAYALFIIKNTGHNNYVYEKGFHLGEWLEPEEFRDKIGTGIKQDNSEICTAYLHYTMSRMAEIAHALHKPDDEALFAEYADGTKRAYNNLFLKDGTIDTDRQAKLVRPLALGLLDGASKQKVQERLIKAVENRAYRTGTGFLSTPFVLPVLTESGRADTAYKMLENTKAPGWLSEVKAGATTVWEDWEGKASHNHYSPGAVCEWLFDTVAGIRPDGENRFIIAPIPGGTLTRARAVYQSLYGMVESRWERTAEGFRFTVSVPVNTTAEIRLPDKSVYSVNAGNYVYEIRSKSV